MEIHRFYISKMQRKSKHLVPGDSHVNIMVLSVCIQRTDLQWALCSLQPFNVSGNNVLSLKMGIVYMCWNRNIHTDTHIYVYLQDIISLWWGKWPTRDTILQLKSRWANLLGSITVWSPHSMRVRVRQHDICRAPQTYDRSYVAFPCPSTCNYEFKDVIQNAMWLGGYMGSRIQNKMSLDIMSMAVGVVRNSGSEGLA